MRQSTIRRALGRLIAVSVALLPAVAGADSANNVKVLGVGIQGGQMYIHFATVPPGCRSTIVYQSADATAQFVMSLVLTARTSGLPVAPIDYHRQGADGPCWVDLLEL